MPIHRYILRADISGYKVLIRLHNTKITPRAGNTMININKSHTKKVVSDFLKSMIDAVDPQMHLNKLKGDVALFFCESEANNFASNRIREAMDKAQESFKTKASELIFFKLAVVTLANYQRI